MADSSLGELVPDKHGEWSDSRDRSMSDEFATRQAILTATRDEALAIAQLAEQQIRVEARFPYPEGADLVEYRPIDLAHPGFLDSTARFSRPVDGDTLASPSDIANLARKVRAIIDTSNGKIGSADVFSLMLGACGIVSYDTMLQRQYVQAMSLLDALDPADG